METFDALEQWGAYEVVSKFDTGIVSDVYLLRLNDELAVARFGSRPESYLHWEIELLEFLNRSDIRVPRFLRTSDGRPNVGGLTVMEFIDGREPEGPSDDVTICNYLARLHEATRNYPQRPLSLSTDDAPPARGENIDMSALPPDKAELCLKSWGQLPKTKRSVVHGDPSPSNSRITNSGVTLLDWDEARVDTSLIDFGYTSHDVLGLGDVQFTAARRSFLAWDAAVCWSLEKGRDWSVEVFNRLAATDGPALSRDSGLQ